MRTERALESSSVVFSSKCDELKCSIYVEHGV